MIKTRPIPPKRPVGRRLGSSEPPQALEKWVPGFASKFAISYFEDKNPCALADRPDHDPDLPEDITALEYVEVGRLHWQYTQYCAYLEQVVALADVDAAEADAYLEHVKARTRLQKGGTVADKTAKTLNDETYLDAEQEHLKREAVAKLLKARLRGYDKHTSALSREMTRREYELRAGIKA